MNLFSQSKLTLKLKNSNSTLSAAPTNKYQKPEKVDLLKSELSLNSSIKSENDSFIEVLHTAQSCEEQIPLSQNVFKSSPETNLFITTNELKQCPVCLQMIDIKQFTNHVKSCGSAHNLSSEVLIKAVDLQERQVAEREALGLPKLNQSKDVKKKQKCNLNKQTKLKIGNDPNLDLAIAMSVSLQESKEADIIKESETLLEAGLDKEATEKRKTLESFGFVSNQPTKYKSKVSKTNSLLFKQTKEGREKRITEKVAMILIDSDTDTSLPETLVNQSPNAKLRSTYLNKIRNSDNKFWKISLLEEDNFNSFYVNKLSKFIRPCKMNRITDLKNQLPAYQITTKNEPSTSNEEFINTSHSMIDKFNIDEIPVTPLINDGNKTKSEYSFKWKSMVGNQFMSDVTIFTKDEHEIPAHVLVFHVQCPDILDDTITEESDTLKSKKLIMWLEYSYEACLAFLEFIYSGQESFISHEHKEDYLNLGKRYNMSISINNCEKHGFVSKEQYKVTKRKSQEFSKNSPFDCKRFKASSPDMFMSDDENVNINFLETAVNDEKSLSIIKTEQWLLNCSLNQSQHHSSFTENPFINVSPQNNLPENSPRHSFHSASTVSLRQNHIDFNLDHEMDCAPDIKYSSTKSSVEELGVKPILTCNTHENMPYILGTPLKKIPTLTTSEKPELFIVSDNSDSESISMTLTSNIMKPGNCKSIIHVNLIDECNDTFLSKSNTKNKTKNTIFNSGDNKREHYIDIIDLDDDSSNSIHSVCTYKLNRTNNNKKLYRSLFDNSMSAPRNRPIIVDDDSSIFSSVTNKIPFNNKAPTIPLNNNNIIDLIEDSSDSVSSVCITSPSKNNLPMVSMQTSESDIFNAQNNYQNSSTSFSNFKNSERDLNPANLNYELNYLDFDSLSSKNNQLSNSSSLYSQEDCSTSIKTNTYLNSLNEQILLQNKDDFKLLSKPLNQSFKQNTVSSTFVYTAGSVNTDTINNDDITNTICSNENNVLDKLHLDSESIGNTMLKSSLILPSNSFGDSLVNSKEVVNIISCSPIENIIEGISNKSIKTQVESTPVSDIKTFKMSIPDENNYDQLDKSDVEQLIDDPWMEYDDFNNSIKPINTQTESNQVSGYNTSKISNPNENNYDQSDKLGVEQLIDDPWIEYDDYNDWQPNNSNIHSINPQCISPILSERNFEHLENKSEEKTPTKNLNHFNSDFQTPCTISNNCNKNSEKKNSVTPNKYGCRKDTPKSLRKTRSESVIGSKEQVTPLPDYSAMKTPDLRKEFDRYGLKDLGRRKGKLMLRHIYDALHPVYTSKEATCTTETDQYSDKSDNSELEILDYECGNHDELETFSQINSTNKTSLEVGFKQLLAVNKDLHNNILRYEPIWIEDLKEKLKQHNVIIGMQKLMTFLDDKCVTFRMKSLNDQRQKTNKKTKRKKLF